MHKISTILVITTMFILTGITNSLAAWQVNIEVSTPNSNSDTGIASSKLAIGTDPYATDGYDNKLDTRALAGGPIEAPIQAYILHPEYPSGQQKLWRDFRKDSLPLEWELEVQSGSMNSSVSIKWDIEAPDNLHLSLIDQGKNREVDMVSSSNYSYTNTTTTPKKFLLKVSEGTEGISPTTGNGDGGGGVKGGGCGFIKNVGKERDAMNDGGQITLNMIMLLIPLLLPVQHYVRRLVMLKQNRKVRL